MNTDGYALAVPDLALRAAQQAVHRHCRNAPLSTRRRCATRAARALTCPCVLSSPGLIEAIVADLCLTAELPSPAIAGEMRRLDHHAAAECC